MYRTVHSWKGVSPWDEYLPGIIRSMRTAAMPGGYTFPLCLLCMLRRVYDDKHIKTHSRCRMYTVDIILYGLAYIYVPCMNRRTYEIPATYMYVGISFQVNIIPDRNQI